MSGDNDLPRCGSCKWFERQPMQLKQGFCYCLPPQCTTLPQAVIKFTSYEIAGSAGLNGTGVLSFQGNIGSFTARPTIKSDDRRCRFHEPMAILSSEVEKAVDGGGG